MSFDVKEGSRPAEPRQPVGEPVLYEQVLAEFHRGQVSEVVAKVDKSTLVAWLNYIGGALIMPVGPEFNSGFETTLHSFMNDAGQHRSLKTVTNMASRLKGLRKAYLSLAAVQPLPTCFLETVQECMRLKGLTLSDVKRDVGPLAYDWARGHRFPRKRDSIPLIHKFETYLGLSQDTLHDKFWNTKKNKGLRTQYRYPLS